MKNPPDALKQYMKLKLYAASFLFAAASSFVLFGAPANEENAPAEPSPEDNTSSYPDAKKLNSALKLFWVSCGDRDRVLEAAKTYEQFLTEKNINHVWHLDSGGHEWPVWKNDLYLVAQRLFRD